MLKNAVFTGFSVDGADNRNKTNPQDIDIKEFIFNNRLTCPQKCPHIKKNDECVVPR